MACRPYFPFGNGLKLVECYYLYYLCSLSPPPSPPPSGTSTLYGVFCYMQYRLGFDKIGPFFWHFMLLALPFFWPNYANFYALLAEKCSLMLDILNSNSVKHDLTINLITMAEYMPGMAAKIAGTLSYECIPTSIQSHAQRTTGTLSCTCTAPVRWKPNCIIKFLNNFASMALCQNSMKMLFMWEENARKS